VIAGGRARGGARGEGRRDARAFANEREGSFVCVRAVRWCALQRR